MDSPKNAKKDESLSTQLYCLTAETIPSGIASPHATIAEARANISVFQNRMVTKRRYLSEGELTELMALSSALSGPLHTLLFDGTYRSAPCEPVKIGAERDSR